jgi:hypothetical protein
MGARPWRMITLAVELLRVGALTLPLVIDTYAVRHAECVGARWPSHTTFMKATTLLERQHQQLRQLCDVVELGSASLRESLLPQLAGDLVAHLAIETQLFYPTISRLLRDESWTREGHARHVRARLALERTFESAADGQAFSCAIADLRAIVEHHADEEEQILFPRADREIDATAMRDLAHAMLALYHVKVEIGYSREWSLPSLPSSAEDSRAPLLR